MYKRLNVVLLAVFNSALNWEKYDDFKSTKPRVEFYLFHISFSSSTLKSAYYNEQFILFYCLITESMHMKTKYIKRDSFNFPRNRMMTIADFCDCSIFQVFLVLCQEFTKITWWACFFKKKKKKSFSIESYQLLSLRLKVTMISPSTTSDCLCVYRGWLQLSPIVYHIYSPQCLWGLEPWS